MDAISYSYADKQAKRIKKFIENPDSTSGIVTVPSTIEAGETITIPVGRTAILPDVLVEGDLVVDGTVFIPSGSTFNPIDVDATNGVFETLKVQNENVSPFSGFKNLIINGNFDIWQRGTSQTISGYGSDDRWGNANFGSTKTHSRIACTDVERALFNALAFSRTVVSSVAGANNYVHKIQYIEDVTKLAGKTVTLSFWAKADSNKNIAIELEQSFGSGGAPSSNSVLALDKVALTTTWQKKTVTFTVPNILGKTLGTDGVHTSSTALRFFFEAGSAFNLRTANLGQQSGTFDIAQVQLEEGSVATPFEQRPIGLEFSLCQRYYQASVELCYTGNTTNGLTYSAVIMLPVWMRTPPTVTLHTNRGLTAFSQPALIFVDTQRLGIGAVAASNGSGIWDSMYNLSAEL